jgi:hypothetical protein
MIFLLFIASEVFIYVKHDNIYMPLLFCNFFPRMSVAMLLDTKYLLLNYTMWEYAVIIIAGCASWSFYSGGISICFHGYCFLHFGSSWRELKVATLVWKVLAVRLRFYDCIFPWQFPLFTTTNCDSFSRRSCIHVAQNFRGRPNSRSMAHIAWRKIS